MKQNECQKRSDRRRKEQIAARRKTKRVLAKAEREQSTTPPQYPSVTSGWQDNERIHGRVMHRISDILNREE